MASVGRLLIQILKTNELVTVNPKLFGNHPVQLLLWSTVQLVGEGTQHPLLTQHFPKMGLRLLAL